MRLALLLLVGLTLASCDSSGYVTPEVSYIQGRFLGAWRVETAGTRTSKNYSLTLRLVERDGTVEQYPGDAGELTVTRYDDIGTSGIRQAYRVRMDVETISGTYDVAENRIRLTLEGEGQNGAAAFRGIFTGRLGVASDRMEGTLRAQIPNMPDGRHDIDKDLILESQY